MVNSTERISCVAMAVFTRISCRSPSALFAGLLAGFGTFSHLFLMILMLDSDLLRCDRGRRRGSAITLDWYASYAIWNTSSHQIYSSSPNRCW